MANAQLVSQGGTRTAVRYSGANSAGYMVYSGQGRLNGVIMHQGFLTLSGVVATFYDAHAAYTSVVAASGHIPLGATLGAHGVSGQRVGEGVFVPLDAPFFSGLASIPNSGCPGHTIIYTPGTPTKQV